MLETGRYGTIDELAAGERINSSYVSRVLRLTLLYQVLTAVTHGGASPTRRTLIMGWPAPH
jgi:hypothetical protein